MLRHLRPYTIPIALALLVGSVLFFQERPGGDGDALPDADGSYRFLALGGEWRAETPEWVESNGYWRVKTDFFLDQQMPARATSTEVLASLCKTFLYKASTEPPQIPSNKVYRIDLNVFMPRDGGMQKMLDRDISVPVIDSTCHVLPEDETYFPRFAPPLMDWELRSVFFEDGGSLAAFRFHAVSDDVDRPFPFAEACQAVLADQVYRDVLEQDERLQGLLDQVDTISIRLSTFQIGDSAFFNIGSFKGMRFKRAGNRCVDGVESDA